MTKGSKTYGALAERSQPWENGQGECIAPSNYTLDLWSDQAQGARGTGTVAERLLDQGR